MTKANRRLATAIVQRYRQRFGRGPTAGGARGKRLGQSLLGDVQTEVEQSLAGGGGVGGVWPPVTPNGHRRFCAATEEVLGRKVLAMLGDHNAVANSSVMVFLLGPERPSPSARRRRGAALAWPLAPSAPPSAAREQREPPWRPAPTEFLRSRPWKPRMSRSTLRRSATGSRAAGAAAERSLPLCGFVCSRASRASSRC